LIGEVEQMATQGERQGQGADRGLEASGLHREPRHPDDPWYQPESGVPRDEDAYEHPPLSEDD
jgi:hypothetical protein